MNEVEPYLSSDRIAYFTMEIGIRPEMHTYSGGLGLLAGDAARSAADLTLPIVFVTLASREGSNRQEIDAEGHQIDAPDPWNPEEYLHPDRRHGGGRISRAERSGSGHGFTS